ncbi:BppU family phage baseplate upper protein [Enterococcus sp. AZ109]|uniref:BppU family phage baseplate upper protein n=1 Tax=Enterococcus sp. AZ109 TaxID=2774634 RepID=UPI003F27FF4C
MAEENYQSFSLDIDKAASKNLNQLVTGRLGDHLLTGVIVSTLENDKPFDLTGYTIRFEGTTRADTVVVDADNVEIVNLKEGKFKYTFSNKVFSVLDQYHTAYFSFEKDERRATTENFIINVVQNVDITWEEAQSYISILNALINKFNSDWKEFEDKKTKTFDDFVKSKETQYKQLTDTAARLGIDFGTLQTTVTQLKKDVPLLEAKATQLNNDLSALDTKSKDVSAAYDTTKKNVNALDVTVTDLTKRSTELKAETTSLEGRVSTLKTDTSSLDQKAKTIQEIQAGLAADVAKVNKIFEESNVYNKSEVFTKQETSVNVLDTVSGTRPVLYSEQLDVDGDQGTGSIYVKDSPLFSDVNLLYQSNVAVTSSEGQYGFCNFRSVVDLKTNFTSLERDTEYTLTVRGSGTSTSRMRVYIQNPTIYTYTQSLDFKGSELQTLSITFSIPSDVDQGQGFIFGAYDMDRVGGCRFEWATLVKGSTPTEKHINATEDYGVVHGQPNLLDGSDFSLFNNLVTLKTRWVIQSESNLNIDSSISDGIKVSSTDTSNPVNSRLYSRQTIHEVGQKYGSLVTVTMKAGSKIYFGDYFSASMDKAFTAPADGKYTAIFEYTGNSVNTPSLIFYTQDVEYIVHKVKLIKGSVAVMDDWTPSQVDSGLTVINKGMIPCNTDQYAALADPLGVVRAETTIVGRGAEIQFDFNVISELEKRYPYLFVGMTLVEKVQKYKDIVQKISIKSAFRGQGIGIASKELQNIALYYIYNVSDRAIGFAPSQSSADITTVQVSYDRNDSANRTQLIRDNGIVNLKCVSNESSVTAHDGAASDGITPAWVEVRDISLKIELEIDGRIVVEEIAAEAAKTPISDFVGSGITQNAKMDFIGKVRGSIVENPNVMLIEHGSRLILPQFPVHDNFQDDYDSLMSVDGKERTTSSVSGRANYFPMLFVKWNIVEDIKRRYEGLFTASGADTLEKQIDVARKIISNCNHTVLGRGNSYLGSKLNIAYQIDDSDYSEERPYHESDVNQEISQNIDVERAISKDGCIYIATYTDGADGITVSKMYIDYVSLEYTINLKLSDIIETRLASINTLLNETIDRVNIIEGGK